MIMLGRVGFVLPSVLAVLSACTSSDTSLSSRNSALIGAPLDDGAQQAAQMGGYPLPEWAGGTGDSLDATLASTGDMGSSGVSQGCAMVGPGRESAGAPTFFTLSCFALVLRRAARRHHAHI